MKKIIIDSLKIILIATIFSFGLGVALAWSGPTASPAGSSAVGVMNVSGSSQVKQGNLWISGLDNSGNPYTNGLIVQNGNFVVGSALPSNGQALYVTGALKATGFCVGSTCYNSWPSAGPAGPAGYPGPTGATGATGPQGNTGLTPWNYSYVSGNSNTNNNGVWNTALKCANDSYVCGVQGEEQGGYGIINFRIKCCKGSVPCLSMPR